MVVYETARGLRRMKIVLMASGVRCTDGSWSLAIEEDCIVSDIDRGVHEVREW